MSHDDGECHTAHTFIGATGACPGFSLQAKEGVQAFGDAVQEKSSQAMIDQVRLLYSDSPHEGFLEYFPNAIGIAEELLHLVVRCEECTGRTWWTPDQMHEGNPRLAGEVSSIC